MEELEDWCTACADAIEQYCLVEFSGSAHVEPTEETSKPEVFLVELEQERTVAEVGLHIMHGMCVCLRSLQCRGVVHRDRL
ncbi:hypothetical protein CRG98_007331 [Punica granatum]|uniref:Uncharacterized protein n=1 Tax=Punica granatum TaxID=22663 RepID=A0A2I0KUV7_PUNGR|nr:hypothetical protein CRG98_007331 [Punica granatum]